MKAPARTTKPTGPSTPRQPGQRVRDTRFHQLLDLAREGDLGAIAELWNRYGYRFPEDLP